MNIKQNLYDYDITPELCHSSSKNIVFSYNFYGKLVPSLQLIMLVYVLIMQEIGQGFQNEIVSLVINTIIITLTLIEIAILYRFNYIKYLGDYIKEGEESFENKYLKLLGISSIILCSVSWGVVLGFMAFFLTRGSYIGALIIGITLSLVIVKLILITMKDPIFDLGIDLNNKMELLLLYIIPVKLLLIATYGFIQTFVPYIFLYAFTFLIIVIGIKLYRNNKQININKEWHQIGSRRLPIF